MIDFMFVCLISWFIYERGDTVDGIFLIFFALSQIQETSGHRLFAKLFLPSIALVNFISTAYVNKTISNKSRSGSSSKSSNKSSGSVSKSNSLSPEQKEDTRPRKSSKSSSKYSSPSSSAKPSPEKDIEDEEKNNDDSDNDDDVTRTSRISVRNDTAILKRRKSKERCQKQSQKQSQKQNSNGSGKFLKGSDHLSRRMLTLTCHLSVILNTVLKHKEGLQFGDSANLVVYLTIISFIVCLPVLPGIGVIIIKTIATLLSYSITYRKTLYSLLVKAFELLAYYIKISIQTILVLVGNVVNAIQLEERINHVYITYVNANVSAWEDSFISSTFTWFTWLKSCTQAIGPESVKGQWYKQKHLEMLVTIGSRSSVYLINICSAVIEKDECIYALVFFTEPYLIELFDVMFGEDVDVDVDIDIDIDV